MLQKSLYTPSSSYAPVVGVVSEIGESAGGYRRLLVEVRIGSQSEDSTTIIEVLADRRITDVPMRLPVSLIVEDGDWGVSWGDVNTPRDQTPWESMESNPERVKTGVPVTLPVTFPDRQYLEPDPESGTVIRSFPSLTEQGAHVVIPPAYVKHPPVIEIGQRVAIGRVGGTWFYLGADVELPAGG